MHHELEEQSLVCTPRLPGSMRFSEEEWGPQEYRERRMWTLLADRATGEDAIGALVVRFYHDHTALRLPARPSMEAVASTDHDVIRSTVVQDPDLWVEPRDPSSVDG